MELELTDRRKGPLVADGTDFFYRENKKQRVLELCSKNPDVAKSLTPRDGPGCPRIEEESLNC